MKTEPRLSTGIAQIDQALRGGLRRRTLAMILGEPGAGKSTLAQQIAFHHAGPDTPVLYFSTLSEPTMKTLSYLKAFTFFDQAKFGRWLHFVDLGVVGKRTLKEGLSVIMKAVNERKPSLIVVDTVKTFDDLAGTSEIRSLFYEFGVQLNARNCTVLLLGEYSDAEAKQHPLFTIADGLILLKRRQEFGEHRRYLQIRKMRGTDHAYGDLEFRIGRDGLEFLELPVPAAPSAGREVTRIRTGLTSLDDILVEGIPTGSTLMASGATGTGKTVLMLELAHQAAKAGRKALFFSFEDTPEKLRQAAQGLELPIDAALKEGRIELTHIRHPDIALSADLRMMAERIKAAKPDLVLLDSFSTFVNRVDDLKTVRRIIFQFAELIRAARSVGFLTVNVPFGVRQISRYGVEETEVDGVVLLSSTDQGLERRRHIEVYKLRNTAHLTGRHSLLIAPGGIRIFPRYRAEPVLLDPPDALGVSWRVPSGVPGLDKMLGGGFLGRSISLVSGNAGAGKSILGWQFILEGAKRGEPGLLMALEEGPDQILKDAESLGLPLRKYVANGKAAVQYLSTQQVQPAQLLERLTQSAARLKAKRLVLDSITNLMTAGMADEEVRKLLYNLAFSLKRSGVTSLFTMELGRAASLQDLADRAFSPIADNLLMLRYVSIKYELQPSLMVVKTRGSWHDRGTHAVTIERGGLRVGQRLKLDAAQTLGNGHRPSEHHARP